MTRAVPGVFAFLLAFSCHADPRCEAARALVAELADRGFFQGAFVMGLGGSQRCEATYGHADVERRIPFTTRTASDGGSIAKTMTAAALLRLADEGRVDLDAPVRKYVAAYPHEATRVRHLLAHSAGLPGHAWFDERLGAGKPRSNADQVKVLAGMPPVFPPGTRFEYDNAAFDTAAMVIEAATGKRYAEHLGEAFFKPLAMNDAFVRPERLADFPAPRTRGYRRGKDGFVLHDAIDGEAFHGGGNVYLSASDLERWAAGFARDAKAVGAARRDVRRRARLDDGRETGLSLSGWYSDREGRRHHYTGNHQGFFVIALWDDEGRSLGLAGNVLMSTWLKATLPRALAAIAQGRTVETLRPPAAVPPPSGAARWNVQGVGEVTLEPGQPGTWRVRMPSGVTYTAYPAGRDTWFAPGIDACIQWESADRLAWNSVFMQTRGERLASRP